MDEIDATANVVESFEVEETAGKAFKVVDEVCNDETYENKQDKSEEDIVAKIPELSDATLVEGKVVLNAGEVIIKVLPQYCKFSARDRARRLIKWRSG